jgi:hypothetical protein
MRLKGLYFAVPALAIILLNIFFGSIISWFLSIAIIACLAYYVIQVNIENIIYQKTNAVEVSDEVKAGAAAVIKKYKIILSFALLTVVFISSIICISRTTNPSGRNPWFLNNDYHGISNNGITFSKSLAFTQAARDSFNTFGELNIVKKSDQEVSLQFSDFYQPVFAATGDEKGYTPLNNIFPQGFSNSFKISNGTNTIDVKMTESSGGFMDFFKQGGGKKLTYDITITSKDPQLAEEANISLPYSDHIVVEDRELKEGKLLYNLFLNSRGFATGQNETYQVLELILRQLGETYLLANYKGEGKTYTIFPARDFIANRYQLYAEGQPVQPMLNNTASLVADHKFYIGFHNVNEKAYFSNVNNGDYDAGGSGSSLALLFDYPPTYLLSGPEVHQQTGSRNLRFISNNNDDIIASELKEGFFFKNYGLTTDYTIHANIDYLSQGPNVPLEAGISDHNRNNTYYKVANNHFRLQSSDSGIHYLFTIRDFSQNGFHFNKLVLFSLFIYLGFVVVLIFFPGKSLVRIEPVIFAVIYALLIVRFILYWRLATFPPLENISKYELENTILNFDYKWGIKLPVPLTIIWVYLFLTTLTVYRYLTGKGKKITWSPAEQWSLKTIKRINAGYAVFIGLCALLYFINDKVLHIEVLIRVTSIIVPVIGYCYFAMLANKYFSFDAEWVKPGESKFYVKCKAYLHYFINNPAFIITLLTIMYFGLTDRGFAILFTLFILLKNIFLNFLKKPFNSEQVKLKNMLLRPNNYWIYGILSLVVYLVILSFKSLFYYLITYKLVVLWLLLLIPCAVLWLFYKKYKKIRLVLTAVLALFTLLLAIPPTRNLIEAKATGAIKHVQYRASIIHQPISELLAQNTFSSFQTRKIIETAENQWFINSYINKAYDNDAVINLRPYSKVGVDYNTQTRDVVIARFVIGELGNFTMYLILVLTLLPLILYLISYRLTDIKYFKLNYRSYAGILPLLILFTISLFVWLTATNRFVFFGQDFPFLSLTSKLSVVLPLILFGITLTQQPETYRSHELKLKNNFARYAFFTLLVAGFALTTIKSNELSSNNFSIIVEKTKTQINKDLNGVLYEIQDSLDAKHRKYTYSGLVRILGQDKRFKALLDDSLKDNYTKSIFRQLVEKPSSALRIDNPLYMIYDNDKYTALYNEHLYLELPAVENRKVWNGSIREEWGSVSSQAHIDYNGNRMVVPLPYSRYEAASGIRMAVLPAAWFVQAKDDIGIVGLDGGGKNEAEIFMARSGGSNISQLSAAYGNTCNNEDVLSINAKGNKSVIAFSNAGNVFAVNKWINGGYEILYPQKEHNFWMYHFANAVRNAYTADSMLQQHVGISLDYTLVEDVQKMVDATYAASTKGNKRFKFSVIAADGDGNISTMNDFVSNRILLDPNDKTSINRLQQRHFFYSNIRNERDQWGNSNLMSMHLGPGSSIKPVTTAAIASQVNAGWGSLYMRAPNQTEYNNYGGFKLRKPWENDDHYRAGLLGVDKFLEVSSNFYQSAMIFLGSYPKSSFVQNNTVSLKNVLSGQAGNNNSYPVFEFNGGVYYLPNYNSRKGNWPETNYAAKKKKSYFGNEHSVLATGLESNLKLHTSNMDENGYVRNSYTRVNIADSLLYGMLSRNKGSNFLWSFPEQSSFMQAQRAFPDAEQNFNLGLKTATLGGYPYQMSPFMMLQMYTSLFTQNRNTALHVLPGRSAAQSWQVDSTWQGNDAFIRFLASFVFKGMNDVIYGGSGTAHGIGGQSSAHPGFYFYAKTGTINEQGSGAKNSRRLVVAIANKDLQVAENIGRTGTKVYTLYFAVDNNRDFDWALLNNIINRTMASRSFLQYFNQNNR